MKLSTYFNLTVGLLGMLLLVVAGSLFYLTNYQHQIGLQVEEAIESVRASEELDGTVHRYNREQMLFKVTGDDEHRLRRRQAGVDLKHWLAQVDRYSNSEKEQELVIRIKKDLKDFLLTFEDLKESEIPASQAFARVDDYRRLLTEPLRELIEINLNETKLLRIELADHQRVLNLVGIIIIVLFVIMSAAFLIATRRLLYNPLQSLHSSVEKYSSGDLEARTEITGLIDIRAISKAFNEMLATLAKQRESQAKFLASLAHDLKNPLGAIRMSAQIMREARSNDEEDAGEIAQIIERQTEKLDTLVGDFLDVARIEAGQFKISARKCDMKPLIRETVRLFQATTKKHNILFSDSEAALECYCDPTRISQVLNNLLSNAIKYSPDGGKIEVFVRVNSSDIVVSIADNGMGIPFEEQSKVFEAFQRSQTVLANTEGSGLGLSVVKRIIEAHNGRISLESKPGSGTVVSFSIPRVSEHQSIIASSDFEADSVKDTSVVRHAGKELNLNSDSS